MESEPKKSRGPIAWMAGNSVAANLLMVVFLLGGLFMGTRIKQEVFPEFDLDIVTISVAYPGASPEEVEQGIVLAVEQAVQGLEGVDEVTATASEGSGTVTVEALAGADIQRLAQDIQGEVDRITTFPDDAEEPSVKIAARRREVVSLVVYGRVDERDLRESAEQLRDGLLQEPGITQVDLSSGIRALEISIEVPQHKLRAYGLTLDQVAQRLRQAAVEVGGGSVKTGSGEVLLRVTERRDWGREFAKIPVITTTGGSRVLLEDVADIRDGFAETDTFATYNGLPAIEVEVYRVGDQTPLGVSEKVRNYVDAVRPELPAGIMLDVRRDRSEIYNQRLNLLLKNGFIGLSLVFILLAVFLEARLAFWVAMGIPISFLGSLLFLPMLGVTINMVSMFAFIIALGIVVDDAIVVGENIYFFRQQGDTFLRAAVKGARQVAMPVTFSILTNMVAFLPLAFVPGRMGKIFLAIPMVVITTFLISLIESLFILPAHLGHLRDRRPWGPFAWLHRAQQGFSGFFTRMIHKVYGPFLKFCVNNRYFTVAVGLAILLSALGYVMSGRMGMTLFPRVESDYAYVSATLPFGSPVEKTTKVRDRLIETARQVVEENGGDTLVEGIYSQVNGHSLWVRVYLTDPETRPISTRKFIGLWREKTGEIAGLETLSLESNRGGPGSGKALSIELTHRDLDVLELASEELAAELLDFASVKDVDDGFSPGKRQLNFTMTPQGRAMGLTSREVARQVRNSFYGAQVLRQQRGRNEIRVMVRFPKAERVSEYNIEELLLRAPGGGEIPLRDAVKIGPGRAYTHIKRRLGRRVITVTADVEPPEKAPLVTRALKEDILVKLMGKYPGLGYGFEGRQADIAESMQSLFRGLGLACLVMFILLAVPLQSYVQPAIVMVSIPFGMVGAVLGHMIMGYSLSVMSMFGVVALSGVVVNDSLLLIDFANRAQRRGEGVRASIRAAGIQRFRPVILTTLTTFGGLAPMIFESSRQARFLIPMAISLGFGILFATFITLLLVPCFYVILEDFKKLGERI